jgi:hypothetical protein
MKNNKPDTQRHLIPVAPAMGRVILVVEGLKKESGLSGSLDRAYGSREPDN